MNLSIVYLCCGNVDSRTKVSLIALLRITAEKLPQEGLFSALWSSQIDVLDATRFRGLNYLLGVPDSSCRMMLWVHVLPQIDYAGTIPRLHPCCPRIDSFWSKSTHPTPGWRNLGLMEGLIMMEEDCRPGRLKTILRRPRPNAAHRRIT
jgi:hypothetical protein